MPHRLPLFAIAAGALGCYLGLALPLMGAHRRRHAADQDRLGLYRAATTHSWLLAGLAAGLAGLGGERWSSLGIRLPHAPHSPVAVSVLCVLVSLGAGLAVAVVRPGAGSSPVSPVSPAERRAYVGVALTAAITEEVLFRGFLLLVLTRAGGCSVQTAALVSAIAFGANHFYQGLPVALAATVAGYALAQVYLQTGSLLIPVALHALIDLSALRHQRCSGASAPSMWSPSWNVRGAASSTPSEATRSSVGAAGDAR